MHDERIKKDQDDYNKFLKADKIRQKVVEIK